VQLQLDTFGHIGEQLREEMDRYADIVSFTKKEIIEQ